MDAEKRLLEDVKSFSGDASELDIEGFVERMIRRLHSDPELSQDGTVDATTASSDIDSGADRSQRSAPPPGA